MSNFCGLKCVNFETAATFSPRTWSKSITNHGKGFPQSMHGRFLASRIIAFPTAFRFLWYSARHGARFLSFFRLLSWLRSGWRCRHLRVAAACCSLRLFSVTLHEVVFIHAVLIEFVEHDFLNSLAPVFRRELKSDCDRASETWQCKQQQKHPDRNH